MSDKRSRTRFMSRAKKCYWVFLQEIEIVLSRRFLLSFYISHLDTATLGSQSPQIYWKLVHSSGRPQVCVSPMPATSFINWYSSKTCRSRLPTISKIIKSRKTTTNDTNEKPSLTQSVIAFLVRLLLFRLTYLSFIKNTWWKILIFHRVLAVFVLRFSLSITKLPAIKNQLFFNFHTANPWIYNYYLLANLQNPGW